MLNWKLGAVCALAAAVVATSRSSESRGPALLALHIVPTRHDDKIGRSIELYGQGRHFHVVVTNVSDRPLRLWRDWCSWGYFALSFVATGEDGRRVTIRKKDREWSKNFPDSILVPPGEHLVLEVSFDDSIWQDTPLPEPSRSRAVKLQAVYEIQPDEETAKRGVWTGQVRSTSETYTLWR